MDDPIDISIVIPNRDNAPRLERVLDALRDQASDLPFEILIVDNNSGDNSVEVAQSRDVRVLSNETPNPYISRNMGIAHARGEYILLLDSTCIPASPDLLSILYQTCTEQNAGLVVGNIQFEMPEEPSVWEITDRLLFIQNREGGKERVDYPGGILFFPKKRYEEVGPFREDMRSGADVEWTRRVANSESNIVYAEDAIALYSPKKMRALLSKAYRIGKGHHRLLLETNSFKPVAELLRMRPPSPNYLNEIINTRGVEEYKRRKISLIFTIWTYRIALGLGRVFG